MTGVIASTIGMAEGKFGLTKSARKGLGKEESKRVDMAIDKALKAMFAITDETEGRVQWKGLDAGAMQDALIGNTGSLLGVSINDILNAVPIID